MSEVLKDIYMQSVEDMVKEHKNALYCSAWTWEKRFAELIIKEYIEEFEGSTPSEEYLTKIKTHFGI